MKTPTPLLPARPLPISWRFLLVAGLLASLFVGVLWQTARWTQTPAFAHLQSEARSEMMLHATSLRGVLAKYEYLPEMLAARYELSTYLKMPEDYMLLDDINHMLDEHRKIAGVLDIYLLNAQGLTVAASNWQLPRNFIGQNFAFRPYFKDAILGLRGRFYGLGTTSGARGYYFSYPVRDPASQNILGVVVAKIGIDALENPWQDARGEILASTPEGVIFLSSHEPWRLNTLQALNAEERAALYASRRYARHPLPEFPLVANEPLATETPEETQIWRIAEARKAEGVEYLHISYPVPEAGWRLHMLKPTHPVRLQVYQMTLLAGVGYAVLVLAGLFWRQGRKRQHERQYYQRQSQLALERNEARIRALLDNTHAGIVTLDAQGHIQYINPMAAQLFSCQFCDLYQQPLIHLIAPLDRERCLAELDASQHFPLEVLALGQDKRLFPIELTISPLPELDGVVWMATLYDISERKQQETALQQAHDLLEQRVQERTLDLEESNQRLRQEIEEHQHTEAMLRHTRDELVQAAKLALLGQLSASINHELNQPVAAIRAYAENAQAFLTRERYQAATENLQHIVELTQRMAQISAQLKVFARKSDGHLVPVSVQASFQYALRLYHTQIEENGIQVTLDVPEEEIYVQADPVRLEQVMVNLVSNALHALKEVANPCLKLSAFVHTEHPQRIGLPVYDNGAGIAADHLPHIFDPFFTTKASGQGLGLGLSISYQIIKDLQGELSAQALHTGTQMQILLPASQLQTFASSSRQVFSDASPL